MAKRIIAVIVALIVAMALIMGFEVMGGSIFKHPNIDPKDVKAISDLVASMTPAAFLWILLGYAVSSFVGGIIATLISGRLNIYPAIIVGCFLMVGGIMNIIMMPPQPMLFIIANAFVYIPFAWLGYVTIKKKPEPQI
jgi:hypothetical protein